MAQMQEGREVDDLAIEQSGDKPRHHAFFRTANADDFEKLSLRLYLTGGLTTIGTCELNIRESFQDSGFVDPHELTRFDHQSIAVVGLGEDRRLCETRSGHCAVDYQTLAIRAHAFKMHTPV